MKPDWTEIAILILFVLGIIFGALYFLWEIRDIVGTLPYYWGWKQ